MTDTPQVTEEGAPSELGTHWLRLLAFICDAMIFAALPSAVACLMSLFVALDSVDGFSCVWLVGSIVSHTYFAFSQALFGRSVGKRIWGLRVVSADSGDISWYRWVIRYLGYLLLPISFVYMVVFDGKGRQLGDRWARTLVVREPRPRPLWLRCVVCVTTLSILVFASRVVLRVATAQTLAYRIAVDELRAQEPESLPSCLPASVMMSVEEEANFVVTTQDARQFKIYLSYAEEGWVLKGLKSAARSSSAVGIICPQSAFGRIHIVAL